MLATLFQKIISLRHEQLVKGSFWLTVGGMIVNIGGYFFNLLMGRMLTPGEYGSVMTLMSLFIIVSLPSAMITTVTTKFSADFQARKEKEKISRMVLKLTQYAFIGAVIIVLLFFFLRIPIQSFFKIKDTWLIPFVGIMIGTGLISSINQGVYRGFLMFKTLAVLGVIAVAIKVVVGWVLISRHLAVFGALIAVFLSILIPFLLSFFPIKNYFIGIPTRSSGIRNKIISFSLPTFAVTAASTFYLNADLLLVKHYFSSEEAGIYAGASVIGKAIFYALVPISTVFFSLISQGYARKGSIKKELWLSFISTMFGGICAVLIYYFYPQFIVRIFFPQAEYTAVANYIFYYGLYMMLFSIVFLFVNFFLAIEYSSMAYLSFLFALVQLILIFLMHQSLLTVLYISISTLGVFAAILCIMSFRVVHSLSHAKH